MLEEKDLQAIAQLMDTKINGALEQQEKRFMNGMRAIIESDVKRDIQILPEGHGDILKHLPDVDEQAQLKSRVRVLERIVVDLRNEVENLKKAN